MPRRDDIGRDSSVVEGKERLVVDNQAAAPRPLLKLFDVVQQLAVGVEEVVLGAPVALDQRMADEQVSVDQSPCSGLRDETVFSGAL